MDSTRAGAAEECCEGASVTLYSAQVPVRATITLDQISSGKGTVPDLPLGWWYADGHW
jgi:hypothetical protein